MTSPRSALFCGLILGLALARPLPTEVGLSQGQVFPAPHCMHRVLMPTYERLFIGCRAMQAVGCTCQLTDSRCKLTDWQGSGVVCSAQCKQCAVMVSL